MKIIYVLGMHRSGTSVIGHIIRRLTQSYIPPEKDLFSPSQWNAIGNGELRAVAQINNKILKTQNCTWRRLSDELNPNNIQEPVAAEHYHLLRGLIDQATAQGRSCITLKDPRFCLTWPIWHEVTNQLLAEGHLNQAQCFYINRNNKAVSESLQARNQIALEAGLALAQKYKKWLDIWKSSVHLTFPGGCNLDFEQLQSDPDKFVEDLAQLLRADGNDDNDNQITSTIILEAQQIYRSDLVHHKTSRKIHVVTVHHLTDIWIEPQLRYIRQHLPTAIVHAIVDYRKDVNKFDYAYLADQLESERMTLTQEFYQRRRKIGTESSTEHSEWLDLLFTKINAVPGASDDDVVIFMDNDAFPIASLTRHIRLLDTNKVIAVVRAENEDSFPHPCFTMTTHGFWKSNGLTWARKHAFAGQNADVGSALHVFLEENQIPWCKMLRNNDVNLDPILYAVYDSCVYHHGAGSRPSTVCRCHVEKGFPIKYINSLKQKYTKIVLNEPYFYLLFKDIRDHQRPKNSTNSKNLLLEYQSQLLADQKLIVPASNAPSIAMWVLHSGNIGMNYLKPFQKQAYVHRNQFHLKLRNIPSSSKIILFLANPVQRFVSRFNQMKNFHRLSLRQKDALRTFATPSILAESLSSTNLETQCLAEWSMSTLTLWPQSRKLTCQDILSRKEDFYHIGFYVPLRVPSDCKLSKIAEDNIKKYYQKDYEIIELCRELQKEIANKNFPNLQ